jgi:hypothetical protein
MSQRVEPQLVDERDVVVETNALFFRIYDHEPAGNVVSAYDLDTDDVVVAIEEWKKFDRSHHRVSLAAIVQWGTERGAVFIIGSAPGLH